MGDKEKMSFEWTLGASQNSQMKSPSFGQPFDEGILPLPFLILILNRQAFFALQLALNLKLPNSSARHHTWLEKLEDYAVLLACLGPGEEEEVEAGVGTLLPSPQFARVVEVAAVAMNPPFFQFQAAHLLCLGTFFGAFVR